MLATSNSDGKANKEKGAKAMKIAYFFCSLKRNRQIFISRLSNLMFQLLKVFISYIADYKELKLKKTINYFHFTVSHAFN